MAKLSLLRKKLSLAHKVAASIFGVFVVVVTLAILTSAGLVALAWRLTSIPLCLAVIALVYTQISREMHARQRTEQALAASETKLKAIIENTADPIFIKDVHGRYTMMNRAGAALFGLSAEEIIGKNDSELFGDKTGREIMERDRAFLQRPTLTNFEHPTTLNGKQFIYNTSKFPYLSPSGELVGLIGISRDVTEARIAEAELRRQKAELSALNETTLGLLNGLDTESLLESIVINASSLLGIPDAFLYVRDPDGKHMTVRAATGVFESGIHKISVEYGEALSGRIWETGRPIVLPDYRCWDHRKHDTSHFELRAIVGLPLCVGGEVVGVLSVAYTGENESQITDDEVTLLSRFAQMASVALQNAHLYEVAQQEIKERKRAEEALHELAIRDDLTELYNRREFLRLLKDEMVRYWRYKRPMSLILLDVDNFKKVNDTYGHQTGDAVLAWLSGLLRATVRTLDRPARYGGEEFAIIAPEVGALEAWGFAERLRRVVGSTPCKISVNDGETVELYLTISLGVATFPTDGDSEEALIAAADHAMYAANRLGRNRSIMYSDDMATRALIIT